MFSNIFFLQHFVPISISNLQLLIYLLYQYILAIIMLSMCYVTPSTEVIDKVSHLRHFEASNRNL